MCVPWVQLYFVLPIAGVEAGFAPFQSVGSRNRDPAHAMGQREEYGF